VVVVGGVPARHRGWAAASFSATTVFLMSEVGTIAVGARVAVAVVQ